MTWEEEKEKVKELYRFLQGQVPGGYRIDQRRVPNLDSDRAWTAVWYLGNLSWAIPDTVERCDSCGELYHSENEGVFREEDEMPEGAPFGFRCDNCAHEILDFEEES